MATAKPDTGVAAQARRLKMQAGNKRAAALRENTKPDRGPIAIEGQGMFNAPDFSGVAQTASTNQLDMLRTMVATLREKRRAAEHAAALAEQAAAELSSFELKTLPEAMEVAGVAEFKLEDGSVLTVDDGLKAAISKDNRDTAHAWLRDHGHGAVVKVDFIVDVRALDEKKRDKLSAAIAKYGVDAIPEESVHTSTLRALCKELLAKGTELPPSISVFQYKKAVLKEPKGK